MVTAKFTLRLPKEIHERLEKRHESRPHLSMNAMIVEVLREELEKTEAREAKREQGVPA